MRPTRMLGALLVGIWACALEGPELLEDERAAVGASANSPVDFNGDGYTDLAIGVPFEVTDGLQVGGVNVLYGSNDGLTATSDQFWSQDSPGVLGVGDAGDGFGHVLATGDFDGDGYTDLAIGVPFDIVDSASTGSVNVLYGSADGLTAVDDQIWNVDSPGIDSSGHFGTALAVGDFDGDGDADLAIGVPLADPSGAQNGGLVTVLHGSSAGLTSVGVQVWHQDSAGVNGIAEPFDLFGSTLAAGDFDDDGHDDLVIGVAGEALGDLTLAGSVNVLHGSDTGLSASGDQDWDQNSDGIEDAAEAGDRFGEALAIGDFDGDGFDDLAVGARTEDVGTTEDAGAVNVLYGGSGGLSAADDQFWNQSTPGVDGVADPIDQFGWSLAAGDFDEDGRDDLAIGVPTENFGATQNQPGINNAGLVHVLYGTDSGLSGAGDQRWHQDTPDIGGVAEADDGFGWSLAVGDFDGDGANDLVVGVPLEDVGSVDDAGAINVLYGSGLGLTGNGDQVWHQDSPGVLGTAEQNDNFGDWVR